jgi:hypothetical protein
MLTYLCETSESRGFHVKQPALRDDILVKVVPRGTYIIITE